MKTVSASGPCCQLYKCYHHQLWSVVRISFIADAPDIRESITMVLVETLALIAIVAILLYIYVTRNNGYWAKRGIAFEKPLPLFGNLLPTLTMTKNPGQVLHEIYNKYEGEKVVGTFNFMKPSLLVRDPALVSQILTTDFNKFANNDIDVDEKSDPVIARNIFVQRGETWKRNRQALSPAFTIGKIKSSYDKIQDVSEKLVNYLERNPEPEVKAAMSLYTSEIVASWGIGIDGHSFDNPDPILPKLGKMMFEPGATTGVVFTLMTFFPALSNFLGLSFVPKEIPQFFDGVLRNLIEERAKSSTIRKDFLQYFMDLKKKREVAKHEDQNDISDDDIIAGIISFFIEGYETSSLVTSLLLFFLVLNPDVQKKLREEVDELYEKSKGKPPLEAVVDLPYLSRVYSETLRLTGALNMAKQCTQACDLDIGNGKTLKVEKGASISISILGLHKDPKYWNEPENFNPDRFLDDSERVKGTYLPFGEGPRMCIGIRVAHAMIKTAVISIIRNFDLVPTKKTAKEFIQEPKHFMSSQKGGIHFKFSKRR